MEIFITSHHTCFDLWQASLRNWRKYGFEGKINIISDYFKYINLKFDDPNYEIYQENGDWFLRLYNVMKKQNNQKYILLTTDDIFIKDNNFLFLLNTALAFLQINDKNVFNLCYTYNRIFEENFKFIQKIDKISPHFISLRPTIFKIDFLNYLLDEIIKIKNKSLNAADFELLASQISQRDNLSAYGLSRKFSLNCDEVISKGKLKNDISRELYYQFNKKFITLSFFENLQYYYYFILKEIIDNYFPRCILRFLIKKKLFWSIYE